MQRYNVLVTSPKTGNLRVYTCDEMPNSARAAILYGTLVALQHAAPLGWCDQHGKPLTPEKISQYEKLVRIV